MNNLSSENIQYEIKENSISRFFMRIIGLIVVIYLAINFKDHPNIYGTLILFVSFLVLFNDQFNTIKLNSTGIEIIHSNILRIFTVRKTILYSEIKSTEFIPAKFSFIIFILNGILKSGKNSSKESFLIIYKKDGKKIVLRNIGTEEEINYLEQRI